MRILVTIPHYFNPKGGGQYGSRRPDPAPRLQALGACLGGLHQQFGQPQYVLRIRDRRAVAANARDRMQIDVVVCTAGEAHLLASHGLPPDLYEHRQTSVEDPMYLGFECQEVLRERLGQYDIYGYMEDDLVHHDPLFFHKLRWFTERVGDESLLQPNRYEVSVHGRARKLYVDGDLEPRVTAAFQKVTERPQLTGQMFGVSFRFARCLNPHSGCYFLNAQQMSDWARQPGFGRQERAFVGPLESAATLGIMRTFRVYKPAVENASFLEIQHYGSAFLDLIGKKVHESPSGEHVSTGRSG